MQTTTLFKPNPICLGLQFAGCLIVGMGLVEAVAATRIVPKIFRFDDYGGYMAAVGVALSFPNF